MRIIGYGAPVPFGGSRRRARGMAPVPFGGSRKRRCCKRGRKGGSFGTALLLANALKNAKTRSQIASGRRRHSRR